MLHAGLKHVEMGISIQMVQIIYHEMEMMNSVMMEII